MDATRTGIMIVASLAAVSLAACDSTQSAGSSPVGPKPSLSVSATGNGAPSGAHYNLNIIGVANPKGVDFSGGSGGRIFVSLNGNTRINLTEGAFAVLDANGTDGTAAFQLPNPDDGSGNLAYSVYVRALGKPGGSASMTSCFTETLTNSTWCNAGSLVVSLNRLAGGQKFVNVSKELLQVCANVSTDPTTVNLQLVPLFSALGTNYFWQYDNTGLKLAQMRFYPLVTTPIGGTCTRTAAG